jgi:hypothetical protein
MSFSTSFADRGPWSTAAFAEPPDTTPMELDALGEHYGRCQEGRGRWFSLQCVAETLHGTVAPRFVTTLFVATVLIGAGALVL